MVKEPRIRSQKGHKSFQKDKNGKDKNPRSFCVLEKLRPTSGSGLRSSLQLQICQCSLPTFSVFYSRLHRYKAIVIADSWRDEIKKPPQWWKFYLTRDSPAPDSASDMKTNRTRRCKNQWWGQSTPKRTEWQPGKNHRICSNDFLSTAVSK